MTELFVTAGIVCLVGAVVGGGLKLFGAELPFVTLGRQVLLGVLGLGLLLFGVLRDDDGDSGNGSSPTPSITVSVSSSPTPTPSASGEDEVSEGPWSGTNDGLTLEVGRVVRKADGTFEIDATVDNQTGESLSLPLFGNFVASDDLGESYEADPFASDWPDSFPSGQRVSGTITITEQVSQDATTLFISFPNVIGSFEVDSIEVEDIVLP
jgi:hypothetical protein